MPTLRHLILLSMLAVGLASHAHAIVIDPIFGVSGPAGGSAGWGGTISDFPNYVGEPIQYTLFTGVDYVTSTPVGTFTPIFASTQFVMLVNDLSGTYWWSESYNSSIPTGIGRIDFFAGVPEGSISTGDLIFYYDLYSDNPFTSVDPDILIGTGYSFSVPTSAQVLGATAPNAVPEPGSVGLVGLGLLAAMMTSYRRRRKTA